MNFLSLISLRVRNLLKANLWSQYDLSQRSGIPNSTLSTVLKEKCKGVNSETLLNIFRGCDIRIKDFFDDEMFEPENILDDWRQERGPNL